MNQITRSVLMIRPASFCLNEETAVNNYYQQKNNQTLVETQANALAEFDVFAKKLIQQGLQVIIIDDIITPKTPDAIFPNNWVSFHQNGVLCKYPMFAANRRLERRDDILSILKEKGFTYDTIIDYSPYENNNVFLEGTGSFILDRKNKIAYCALSPRSNKKLFLKFCSDLNYKPILFNAFQTVKKERKAIYHTNVMFCIGEKFAVICLDSIDNKQEKENIINTLIQSKKEIIEITEKQVHQFAGNMLQVIGSNDKRLIIMSLTAFNSLKFSQKKALQKHGDFIISNITTIEKNGGGSVRCMLAELF
jgi:hypothetical protein